MKIKIFKMIMVNCDRCGLFSEGCGSICEKIYFPELTRKDYESLEEIEEFNEKRYTIVTGYGSRYDSEYIELTGNLRTLEQCKERHPWITDIGQEFDNLCDNCILAMLVNKEAVAKNNDILVTPFYTACCDKLYQEVADMKFFYQVQKINLFPYTQYLRFTNWYDMDFDEDYVTNIDVKYMKEEDLFFPFYPYCTICKDCLDKYYKITENPPNINLEELSHVALKTLRRRCEFFIYPNERGKELTLHSRVPEYGQLKYEGQIRYEDYFYQYLSKKANLLIKKELSIFFAQRNLAILKKHFRLSNDIISSILNFF